jgi:hypothetical protein
MGLRNHLRLFLVADRGIKRRPPPRCRPSTDTEHHPAKSPKCGSSRRSEYWGRLVQKCPGLRTDGTPYTAIIRRRCRCLDCGQVRIDKEYD